MKKRYPIHDGSSLLSNSRWLAYAAAGTATALGSATSAEAEIHYSGVLNLKFNGSSESDHLALDNGASLFFRHVEDLAEYDLFDFFAVRGGVSNQVGGRKRRPFIPGVDRLYFGQRVSNGQFIGLTSGTPVLISRMSRDFPWRKPGEGSWPSSSMAAAARSTAGRVSSWGSSPHARSRSWIMPEAIRAKGSSRAR